MKPDFHAVDMAREDIDKLLAQSFQSGQSDMKRLEFCLAVAEAMNNAVEHSGADQIEVDLSIEGDDAVFHMFTRGDPFDPTGSTEMPEMNDEDLPEGGFGMAIMNQLADEIKHEHKDGRNTLRIRKKIG